MKVLLDIKDDKAQFFLDLLKDLSFVKATPLDADRFRILTEWQEAMQEVARIKAGKKRGRPIQALLDEL
ncbi:MAG: hypothetical protein KF905_00075 [Flavobacteriales bacterium]|nr:hypothetical protein [Flavobacteriales bacterium]